MNYIFEPLRTPAIPISQSDLKFPVRRIYCVGKNYVDHVKEMGSDPLRDPPCFFMKPADAVTTDSDVPYPPGTSNYHYETELVLAIGKEGKEISAENAEEYIYGYAIGFDMTRRDLQTAAGVLGHPWDTGKGFDYSAPISTIYPASEVGHINSGELRLTVNGELRQKADISLLIWKNKEIIAQLSRLYLLKPGDLIFTGTPAGVGAVNVGDQLSANIEKLGSLDITIC